MVLIFPPMMAEFAEFETCCALNLYTGLFEMIVRVLTICHTQYT